MLTIEKNNLKLPVAQLSLLNGKEVLVLGDYERDLILRTKGKIQVQIQNKFIDLMTGESETVSNDTISILPDLTGSLINNTLIYSIADNSLSYYNGESIITVNGGSTQTVSTEGLLSFQTEQNILNKKVLYSNIGYSFSTFGDLKNDVAEYYINQVIYFDSLKNHYILTDLNKHRFAEGWSPLYLNLFTGGSVEGDVSIYTKNIKASLTLFSDSVENYRQNPKALFIGNPDEDSGLLIKHYQKTIYLDLVNDQNNFIFRTFNGTDYFDLIQIEGRRIAFADQINTAVDLNVNLSTLLRQNVFIERNVITFNYSPVYNKRTTYQPGFALTRENTYLLETDELLIKNPESSHKTLSAEEGLFSSKSYRIRVIELIDEMEVYVKAELTGRYASQDLNDPVELTERHPKVQVFSLETEAFENIDLVFGIGDRDSAGVVMSGTTYDYDGTSFSVPVGDYSFNGSTLQFEETVGGTHKLTDIISVVNLTFYNAQGLEINDLLLYIERDRDKEDQYGAFVHIIDIDTVDDVTTALCHVYGTNILSLYKEMHLVKVGNTTKDVKCNIIQDNTYLLNGIRNFNQLYKYWYNPNIYELEDSWFHNINPINTKILHLSGDLSVFDLDLDFGSLISPEEIGTYFDNIFLKNAHGLYNYLKLGSELVWDGINLDIPRLQQAEQDIEDIFVTLGDLSATEEQRNIFFPTVTTTDVFLNFREGEYVKNQSLVTISLWININVNATGINTIDIENLPFSVNFTNDRKAPVIAYVNNEISLEAFIHPDPLNKITVKNKDGSDFSLAVHEIHVLVSYFA